jgi:hypothetical protein
MTNETYMFDFQIEKSIFGALLGVSTSFLAAKVSYLLLSDRKASYAAVKATTARRENMRPGVVWMCHQRKMMQRFLVSQVKSICSRHLSASRSQDRGRAGRPAFMLHIAGIGMSPCPPWSICE